jgi:four helix bundle protein
MYTFYFEKLEVWRDSIDFIKIIYRITKHFPEEEKFGITSQIRRAGVSISTDISEGNSRSTKRDQANFTNMAYSDGNDEPDHSFI